MQWCPVDLHSRKSFCWPGAAEGPWEPIHEMGPSVLALMPPTCRCHPTTSVPMGQHGREPKVPRHAQLGSRGWLTKGVVLQDTGALALGLGGGLTYLTLEGGEEVLAKLFRHVCLQVGLHEKVKALIVDGLGSRHRRMIEVPQACHGGADAPVEGGILGPPHWAHQLQNRPQNQLPKSQW